MFVEENFNFKLPVVNCAVLPLCILRSAGTQKYSGSKGFSSVWLVHKAALSLSPSTTITGIGANVSICLPLF